MIIGIGTDVVDLERFGNTMEQYGERFMKRMYTNVEREYCMRFPSPREHFAARFAAKEALLKAIGTGKTRQVKWTDIEIYNEPAGQPMMRLCGCAEDIFRSLGGRALHVSLTHSRLVAAAVVVIEA